jgi:glyoxylase-like metal-dependent hydrolase (beta-lactamase superfamily II)
MEQVAEGVWLLRGGFPIKTMNVYLIEDEGGVTVFDAGIKEMTKSIGREAAKFGGVKRVVLGHGHPDHRGAAPGLDAPVYCHEAEVADSEGDGGVHYFHQERLWPHPARVVMPVMLKVWDGGPVHIEGTVAEGDEVAGFQVVHVPGHAPGMIVLWRESDRLALTTDTFYTLDPRTAIKGPPRVPHEAFNYDTAQAKQSIAKLAGLEPMAAWPGHAEPLTGDVAAQLLPLSE